MTRQRTLVVVTIALLAAVVVPLAAMRYTPQARGQVTPPGSTPTTPQPTVPCIPPGLPTSNPGGAGCGHGPGTLTDVAYAWIDRYCNGDAVPTPPGQTTFALNYAIGGQYPNPVSFVGVLTANGVVLPSAPLFTLSPGQKDTRIRTAVVPTGVVFAVNLTATDTVTGAPVIFGNGSNTRLRTAAGPCPGAPPAVLPPTTAPPAVAPPAAPVPFVPSAPLVPVESLPPGVTFPPTR